MSTLMPINPIHSALLYNGKILVVAGSDRQQFANPRKIVPVSSSHFNEQG
jgi:hypothetical protein